MYLLTFAAVASCVGLVYTQSPCLSSEGRSKQCIPFAECEALRTLAKKPNKTEADTNLLKTAFCGVRRTDGVPVVCCPEPEPILRITKPPPPCNTPDGKPGDCKSLLSCPHLANMLQPPVSQESQDYVKDSVCQGPEDYSVCCGPPPDSEEPEEPDSCQAQMTAFPPSRSSDCCGQSVGVGNKIFGGDATPIDEYPWAVIIEYREKTSFLISLKCGGALISGKYVLTAAHCISGRLLETATPKKVRLGEYDTDNVGQDCVYPPGGGEDCTTGAVSIRIEKMIPHPQYVQKQSKRHDIGLIRLAWRAPYTDFIRPVCLPSKDLTLPENKPPQFSMYAVGWGATSNTTRRSNVKLHVKLPFIEREKCQPSYNRTGRHVNLWRGQICAGGVANEDTCSGDSGGPLVYEDQSTFELVGIVSFGPQYCGEEGVPGIYTNVYEYLNWIHSNIVA